MRSRTLGRRKTWSSMDALLSGCKTVGEHHGFCRPPQRTNGAECARNLAVTAHELPVECTSDAWLQIGSVCRTHGASLSVNPWYVRSCVRDGRILRGEY